MTGRPAAIVEMVHAEEIILAFDMSEQTAAVLALLRSTMIAKWYLADACIVRMAELIRDCQVITLDRDDFATYRRNGREFTPIIVPPSKTR